MYYIYLLIDSRTNLPFYVGYTKNIYRRLGNHIIDISVGENTDSDKSLLLKEIIDSGGFPIIKIIYESKFFKDILNKEIEYIAEYSKKYELLNKTKGGLGTKGFSKPCHNARPVCQIDMKTLNIINTFPSAHAAAESVNISQGEVSSCCLRKNRFSSGGFFWCYESDKNNFVPNYAFRKGKNKEARVQQFSLFGEFIKEFSSMTLAANELGLSISKISSVCNGKQKTTGGFKWKKLN